MAAQHVRITCTSYSINRYVQDGNIIAVNVISPDLTTMMWTSDIENSPAIRVIPNPDSGDFRLQIVGLKNHDLVITMSTSREGKSLKVNIPYMTSDETIRIARTNSGKGLYTFS